MSSNVITANKMYAYWCKGTTWKGGDPSTEEHLPFNPMVERQGIRMPEETYNLIAPANALYPVIEVDNHLEPSTITFRMYYRDPLLLACLFTYKGLPAAWTGTNDVMSFNFNGGDEDANICVQLHLKDHSGNCKHINVLLDGGKITGYRWIINEGQAMIEEVDIKFAEISQSTTPIDIDDGLDDASMNQTGAAQVSTIVAVAAASITDGKYFTIQGISATYVRTDYYVWFDKAGDESGDPAPAGYTEIKCDISGDTTAQEVSDCITAAIAAKADFGAANGGGTSTTITVTNANNGDVVDIADVDSGLIVAVTTSGAIAQDGGWSLWDGQLCDSLKKAVHASSCTLTVATAAIPGLYVKSATLEIDVPKAMEHVQSSRTAAITYEEVRNFKATFSGTLKGDNDVSEMINPLSSKTKSTVKFQYASNKYMEFTNAVLKNPDEIPIPKAGESMEVTYVYEGAGSSVLSFSWTGSEATDPSNYITHTDV